MKKYIQRLYDPIPADGGTPTAVSPVTPAPPVVPETPPAEVEETPGPTPEQVAAQETSDSLLKTILGDMRAKPPEEAPVAPAAEAPPPVVVAPPAPVVAAAEPPVPAVKSAKKKLVPFEVPAVPSEVPATIMPVAPTVDADLAYVQSLREDQQEELREMEVAERLFPDRYKGKRKALVEFYRTFDARAPGIANANQEESLEDNADYKALVSTKPALTPLDYKRVNRTIGQEEAAVAVERKLAPEIAANKMRLRELELRPEVTQMTNELHNEVNQLFVADSKSPIHAMAKLFAEKGSEAILAHPDMQLEVAAASQEMPRARALVSEYTLLMNDAKVFDQKNPLHMELFNFIEDQGMALQAHGGLKRNGKSLLTKMQFSEQAKAIGKTAAERKYFTFNDTDVKRLIVQDSKQRIEKRVEKTLADNEKMGFVRKGSPAQSTQSRNEPVPITPPVAAPTISKNSTDPAPTAGDPNAINVADILGLRSWRSQP